MMEPADLRDGDDPATWREFDDSWLGTVVVKRLVWPRGVVIGEIRAQDAAEMGLLGALITSRIPMLVMDPVKHSP
jgi:hypothetical protein